MQDQFKYCPKCKNKNSHRYYHVIRDFYTYKDNICPQCNSDFVKINIGENDYKTLAYYLLSSNWEENTELNTKIIDQILKLYDEDPIEYQQKIMQFKKFLDDEKKEDNNTPKCPTCGSTNIQKISLTSKATKIAIFGIFGMGDNGKTWKCNNCGSKF